MRSLKTLGQRIRKIQRTIKYWHCKRKIMQEIDRRVAKKNAIKEEIMR